jgi:hypothetical protein
MIPVPLSYWPLLQPMYDAVALPVGNAMGTEAFDTVDMQADLAIRAAMEKELSQ